MRGHPFIRIPHVYTDLSTRRALVSEYVEGARFEAVRGASEPERDRYGEIVFRFFFGLLYRDRIALGDPHPGNYLLCPDGKVCFLDFGLLRDVASTRVLAERSIALAVRAEDPAALKEALVSGGYLPEARADAVEAEFALRLMRRATRWYAVPGEHRFSESGEPREHRERGDQRPDADDWAAINDQVNQFTLPPDAALIRRMHGVVAIVLQTLRAGADWGAIAAEYLHDEPPATELGRQEAEFLARRRT
jgi:predicted unusual protein kinase regulating ubiquinone biosynthesis (AarF/ABC1/UbiB family)